MKKNLLALLLLIAAAIVSCNKSSTTSDLQPAATTELPAKAVSYIESNYPDASIQTVVLVTNSAASFLVTLNTTEELAFDHVGEYLGDGANYHHGHPGGDSIHGDSIHWDSLPGGGHHGGGHHGGHHGHGIPVDSLPQAIVDYVTANFSGYAIRHAEYDSLCPDGLVTEVMLEMAGTDHLKLVFDAGSSFLFKATRLPYTDVPQAVMDFISTGYPGYEVCDKAEKYTLADNSIQYRVYLRVEGQHIHKNIRVNEDGTLVCEQ